MASSSSIDLALSENVTCTFTNTKRASLTVVKETLYGDGAFTFASPQLGAFSLTTSGGVASRAFTGLQSGAYAIAETLPLGWTPVSAACDNGDPPDRINLASGASVTCTFNQQLTVRCRAPVAVLGARHAERSAREPR